MNELTISEIDIVSGGTDKDYILGVEVGIIIVLVIALALA